jgi:succinyl-CoA synthetase beta subunit
MSSVPGAFDSFVGTKEARLLLFEGKVRINLIQNNKHCQTSLMIQNVILYIMKLLEYEAKNLLSQSGIIVPRSSTLHQNDSPQLPLPVVLKSQVPTGGRGKAGGIQIVENQKDLPQTIDDLFTLSIKGFRPHTLLAEEKLAIAHEYYLSLTIDRVTAEIRLIAHANGGVEVEDNEKSSYLNIAISKGAEEAAGQQLADYYRLPGQTFVLQDLVENIYACFTANDATLLEINPLVFTVDEKFVAGDCKIELDDSAAFRHDWKFENQATEANFVTLDINGTIATIANGAGLAMATVDAVADSGMTPANFLDIGGGSNTETLVAAFRRIAAYPNIQAIVINVFAGISRCDDVARAIVAAKDQIDTLSPLFIRLAGTNFEAAVDILSEEGIPILATLEGCLAAAKQKVAS